MANLFTKLRILFNILLYYNISIQFTKFYLNYPNITLLGQCVISLGLFTFEKKLKTVHLLKYSQTLGALGYYLGFTRYLKSYIHYYAQLASLLQALKTSLFKKRFENGQQHWAYVFRTRLKSLTKKKLAAFDAV